MWVSLCVCSSTTLITVIVFFIENTWCQFKYDIFAVIFLLNFFSSSLERIEAQTQVHPHVSVYELLTKKNFSIHLPFFAKSYFYTYKLPILIEKKKNSPLQNGMKIAQNCVGFIQILIYIYGKKWHNKFCLFFVQRYAKIYKNRVEQRRSNIFDSNLFMNLAPFFFTKFYFQFCSCICFFLFKAVNFGHSAHSRAIKTEIKILSRRVTLFPLICH